MIASSKLLLWGLTISLSALLANPVLAAGENLDERLLAIWDGRNERRDNRTRDDHQRAPAPQRAVGPVLIVVDPVVREQEAGLRQAREQLPVQELVAQPAVETLRVAVLPWASRRNVERSDPALLEPLANRCCDEFRPVVRTNMRGGPMLIAGGTKTGGMPSRPAYLRSAV